MVWMVVEGVKKKQLHQRVAFVFRECACGLKSGDKGLLTRRKGVVVESQGTTGLLTCHDCSKGLHFCNIAVESAPAG